MVYFIRGKKNLSNHFIISTFINPKLAQKILFLHELKQQGCQMTLMEEPDGTLKRLKSNGLC